MLVAKVDCPGRNEITKMLTMIPLVVNSVHSKTGQGEPKFHGYKPVALPIIMVFIKGVPSVEGSNEHMLTMLLEPFVHIGTDGCRFSEKAPPYIVAA